MIIFKNTETTNGWRIMDTEVNKTNSFNTGMYPNGNSVEDSPVNWTVDYLSNGFKIRDSNNELSSLIVQLSSSASVELKDIYLYKEAEWRVEGIKDYRDELMEVKAVRVRGDRTSRRRAYG